MGSHEKTYMGRPLLKTRERDEHPEWLSLSQLKAERLRPKKNVRPVAYVAGRQVGLYPLFDKAKCVAWYSTAAERAEERRRRGRERLERELARKADEERRAARRGFVAGYDAALRRFGHRLGNVEIKGMDWTYICPMCADSVDVVFGSDVIRGVRWRPVADAEEMLDGYPRFPKGLRRATAHDEEEEANGCE